MKTIYNKSGGYRKLQSVATVTLSEGMSLAGRFLSKRH